MDELIDNPSFWQAHACKHMRKRMHTHAYAVSAQQCWVYEEQKYHRDFCLETEVGSMLPTLNDAKVLAGARLAAVSAHVL